MERNDFIVIFSIIASIITVSTFLGFVIYPLYHPDVTSTQPTPTAASIVTPTPQITPSPSPTVTPTPSPSMPTLSPTRGNDYAFIEFYLDASSNIGEVEDEILENTGQKEINYPDLETRAANLEILAEKYMVDIEDYHVSEELSPVKIKLRDYFLKLKIASQTLKNGARNQELSEVINGMELLGDSMEIKIAVMEEMEFLLAVLEE